MENRFSTNVLIVGGTWNAAIVNARSRTSAMLFGLSSFVSHAAIKCRCGRSFARRRGAEGGAYSLSDFRPLGGGANNQSSF